MRENSIRELQAIDFVEVRHIRGNRNLSDMYTKEDKDDNHYIACRDATMAYPPLYQDWYTDELVTKGGVRDNTHLARRIALNYPDDPVTSLVWRYEPQLVAIDN